MAKPWGLVIWCVLIGWLCVGCTIRSGEHVVQLTGADGYVTAVAVRFVGSEGLQQRVIAGVRPDTRYRVHVQAQIRKGSLQLRAGADGDAPPIVVRPGQVVIGTLMLKSDASGIVRVEESTYNAQGGEYQLQLTIADADA